MNATNETLCACRKARLRSPGETVITTTPKAEHGARICHFTTYSIVLCQGGCTNRIYWGRKC